MHGKNEQPDGRNNQYDAADERWCSFANADDAKEQEVDPQIDQRLPGYRH